MATNKLNYNNWSTESGALSEMESVCRRLIERRSAYRQMPPYQTVLIPEVTQLLEAFFRDKLPGSHITGVRRVGGGASKEQFFFTLAHDGETSEYLLRMDPRCGITETDREREFILLGALTDVVPVPEAAWIDPSGQYFPQAAAIMKVVSGVTKPSGSGLKVSGMGAWLGPELRPRLKDQFIDNLVSIHGYDFRANPLPGFEVPDADPKQAARWAFNYWREIWVLDEGEPRPIVTLAEQWLLDNLPDCDDLVLTHGDYRTGNYLFDEATGQVTAMLDWELAHIGDYHEDLAWALMQSFGTWENGEFRAGDLIGREEFIAEYERRSGRTVNRATLHYYDVMSSWKCYIMCAASGLAAARYQHNHQDVLLTFLGCASTVFAGDLVRLLGEGERA